MLGKVVIHRGRAGIVLQIAQLKVVGRHQGQDVRPRQPADGLPRADDAVPRIGPPVDFVDQGDHGRVGLAAVDDRFDAEQLRIEAGNPLADAVLHADGRTHRHRRGTKALCRHRSPGTVSYTHLDVYKRQHISRNSPGCSLSAS